MPCDLGGVLVGDPVVPHVGTGFCEEFEDRASTRHGRAHQVDGGLTGTMVGGRLPDLRFHQPNQCCRSAACKDMPTARTARSRLANRTAPRVAGKPDCGVSNSALQPT